jgi:hypothetical protein
MPITKEIPIRGELKSYVYGGVVYSIEKLEKPLHQVCLNGGTLEESTWPFSVLVYNEKPGILGPPRGTYAIHLPAKAGAHGGGKSVLDIMVPAEVVFKDWFIPGTKGEITIDSMELYNLETNG